MLLGVREKMSSNELPGKRAGRKSAGFLSGIVMIAWTSVLIFALVATVSGASNQNYEELTDEHKERWDCPTCKGTETYDLDIFNFLGHSWEDETTAEKPPGPKEARAAMENETERNAEDYIHPEYLASVEDAERADVILDVGSYYESSHIEGAIPLYWEGLLDDNNNPKSAAEMAEIFGNAGISPDDSVVVYGNCAPCDDITVAPFVFWALRYVGQDDVKVLDGGLDGWKAAGLATETKTNARPAETYTPRVRSSLLADYDKAASGEYQLVDARTLQEYAADKISGAIYIDYDEVQTDDQVRGSEDLADVFAGLDEDEPIIVYSNAGARAAMVWYALQLMGYEASIYTWNDWEENQPSVKAVLKEARADPNPARPGEVNIYATFDVVSDEGDSAAGFFGAETVTEEAAPVVDEIPPEVNGSDETSESIINETEIEEMIAEPALGEPKVKTMGCVACFDPVTLYASGSSSSESEVTGGVKLGSVGGSSTSKITAAGALIQNQAGDVMATIELASTLSDEYVGTWDATDVPDGTYIVTLAAAAGGKTSYFEDVLTIEIDSSAPVQETTATTSTSTGIRKLGSY
jgi:thiosulfate/3-mercaptopyruvate sulfurtransferase